MAKHQLFKHLATLTLAIALELLTIAPRSIQAQTTPADNSVPSPWEPGQSSAYEPPPDIGSPGRRESGGNRPGDLNQLKCPNDSQVPNPPLTVLVPTYPMGSQTQIAKLMGLTVEARPTFFVYVPETSARTAEFILNDANEKEVYRTNVTLSNLSGIVGYKLPDRAPALEIGKSYQWYFVIRCDLRNRKKDLVVDGWIWRTQLRSAIAQEVQNSSLERRAVLYRQHQIWHEALATLAELRRERPGDPQLTAEWKELLESAGLRDLTDKPLAASQNVN